MHDYLIANVDIDKLKNCRNALIELVQYCFDFENGLDPQNQYLKCHISAGTNGFEKFRDIADYSNAALCAVNAIIDAAEKEKM